MFRKYRIALIEGRPFACHMGVSEHWMIHYLNAGMRESAPKRAEEACFMAEFDQDFAQFLLLFSHVVQIPVGFKRKQ